MSAVELSLISLLLNLLLGGGVVAVVLRHRVQMARLRMELGNAVRDDERTDFGTIVAEIRRQRDEAWTHVEKQDERIDQMEAEIQGLRLARDLDPFPNWVVDRAGKYLYVNREFERYFLEPVGQTYRDIVGKTHEEHWPPDFCRMLKALDAASRVRPDGTARASSALHVPELGETRVTVHKFPIRFKPSGIIVAYAGYITDLEPEDTLIDRQTQ